MALIRFNASLNASIGALIIAALDAGGGNGFLKFFTGSIPATPDTAVTTQTLLGTLTLDLPCATYADKTVTFDPILQDSQADAGGTPTWARLYTSAGEAVIDLDVGDLASNCYIKLINTDVVQGGPILMNSLVIHLGA